MQVLRLSGAALLAFFLIAAIVVAGNAVVGFFAEGWGPDWHLDESAWAWLSEGPAESAAPVAHEWADIGARTIWLWVAAAIAPFGYYLIVWRLYGKDPRRGAIVPLYHPPAGVSPAGARYIMGMGYDSKTIASEIVGLAVRGYLRIVRQDRSDYIMKRAGGSTAELTAAQKYLASVLFRGATSIRVGTEEGVRLRLATEMFQKHLEDEFEGPVFTRNIWAVCFGILVSGGALLAVSFTHEGAPADPAGFVAAGFFAALVTLNAIYFPLMKAPTELGRRLMDEIEGFRMFVAAAEHERTRIAGRPQLTPALFAANLPYAMALDLELDWAKGFAGAVGAAIPSPTDFDWYGQTAAYAHDDGFAGMLRSLGAAVAATLVDENDESAIGPGG